MRSASAATRLKYTGAARSSYSLTSGSTAARLPHRLSAHTAEYFRKLLPTACLEIGDELRFGVGQF